MPRSLLVCAVATFWLGSGCEPPRQRTMGGPVSIVVEKPDVKVIHYTTRRVDNPNPRGETTRAEFEGVRQDLITTCRRFGVTGPDKGPDGWPKNEVYYIVDDQYNSELYHYAEVLDRAALSEAWVRAMMQTLANHPGWGVGVKNIKDGYLLIFADRLMVTGPSFEGCDDLPKVVTAAAKNLGGVRGE